jgi:hypothetical protein
MNDPPLEEVTQIEIRTEFPIEFPVENPSEVWIDPAE